MGVDLPSTVVLSSMGRVVEKRNNLRFVILLEEASVMLKAEFNIWTKVKVRLESAQSPNDFTTGAIDLVNCTSVASRDQIVALGILVN